MIRGESSDAIPKLYIRDLKTNKEEEIKISSEQVGSPGAFVNATRYKHYKN